jgi:hypothetical protein
VPIQAKARERQTDEDPRSIREAAQEGIRGSSGRLPYIDAIQKSFGRHALSGIVAHTDGAAATGARAMGAAAFTMGHHVAFAEPPSLATASHEAAHVIQQRAGVQISEGVGRAGDRHEQHADAVAARVVAGESSEALLDAYVGAPAGPRVQREQPNEQAQQGGKAAGGADITLETGNIGAGYLNNLVHQQICIDRAGSDSKRCFSFAATGAQLPQFSSTWLGWNSWVVGAILKGEVYEPGPVPGASVVNRHTPTAAQGTRWLNYVLSSRLGLQDGYSVGRHNCRAFSQWEFRDAPSHW